MRHNTLNNKVNNKTRWKRKFSKSDKQKSKPSKFDEDMSDMGGPRIGKSTNSNEYIWQS